MAHAPSLRIDDVALATSGEQIIADTKIKVEFPGLVNKDGKRRTVEFDVSSKPGGGKEIIEKMLDKAHTATRKGFEELLSLDTAVKTSVVGSAAA
ncbi:hypothetical protein GCM10025867_47200 (plasmid) [Frondihabitans sucicola]|uniref:Uncharacterized protein n=1 Tax=Frondihabitans sucicola TaxID=1268041 RepID=A0ABN6Y5X6_9MICO|nr:hypothetical protein [Frondihabitans sucicola]BDZ52479.1 hypothetical protein GCM10025867_47200 [Frondihabitans sucicola]